MDTVRLHIEISIQAVDDDYDTGLSLDEWNALTPAERSGVYNDAWLVVAQRDNGGMWPVTEGAAP